MKKQRAQDGFQGFIWRLQGLFVSLHPPEPAKPLRSTSVACLARRMLKCAGRFISIKVPAKHTTRTAGGSFFSYPLTKNAYLRKNSK